MKIVNGKAEGVRIAYIGGGSRGWAWNLMSDLVQDDVLSGTVTLYDIDLGAAEKNVIIGNKLCRLDGKPNNFVYRMEENLEKSLEGADFVVLSILPGSFDEMAVDVHAPEKYGVYQSVGDTSGPGGILRALRTLPMYITFAQAIQKVCPNAWVINYTNPMAMCVQTLHAVFPGIKAFGCCHEVFGTQELVAHAAQKELGIEKIERHEIHTNVFGINHFTWIDSIRYKNLDLMPLYKKIARDFAPTEYEIDKPGNWLNDYFASANRVKLDLCNRFGFAAAAGDRHLAEFCPPWYLKDPQTVRDWKFTLTPVSWRKEHLAFLLDMSEKMATGQMEIKPIVTGEEGVLQMRALLGLGDFVTNVNLPNRGQIPNVPNGTIVETNAHFGYDSVQPVLAGPLPRDIFALSNPHILAHHLCVEACLTRTVEPARRAFLLSPLLTTSIKDGNALFDEMIAGTKSYLNHYTDV